MGCDIHLHVEQRLREGKKLVLREAEYDEEGNIIKQELSYTPEREWREFDWDIEFSDRIYGMFALLADVRNYSDLKHIEIRGFPDDASKSVRNRYFLRVTDNGKGNRSITLDDAIGSINAMLIPECLTKGGSMTSVLENMTSSRAGSVSLGSVQGFSVSVEDQKQKIIQKLEEELKRLKGE